MSCTPFLFFIREKPGSFPAAPAPQIHTREPLGEPVSYSGFKRRLKCTWHQERPALSIRSAWCGTSETYTTTTYPLGGIVFLKQAPFNRVNSLPPDEQALFLMQRMISPTWTKDLLLKNLAFAETLAPLTKIFRLNCTKNPEAAAVMKAAIDQSI